MQNFRVLTAFFKTNDSAKQGEQTRDAQRAPSPLDPSLLSAVGGGVTAAPKNGW